MRVLFIDTSSNYLYTSIIENDNILSSFSEEYGQSLSEIALPKIVSMFEQNNLKPKDIDKIIVVNGPGSFTGIRIGITIAKVYAWSLNIPITTVTSLECMSISSNNEKIHVPILNARRGYVYSAIYDKNGKELLKPQHINFEELKKILKEYDDYEYISNDEFEENLILNNYQPNFIKIVNEFKNKENINPHAVNPEYLKLTSAEENRL